MKISVSHVPAEPDSKEVFLRFLARPDGVVVEAVTVDGRWLSNILLFHSDGYVQFFSGVDPLLGFQLDDENEVVAKRDRDRKEQ